MSSIIFLYSKIQAHQTHYKFIMKATYLVECPMDGTISKRFYSKITNALYNIDHFLQPLLTKQYHLISL